jgi:Exostosin family
MKLKIFSDRQFIPNGSQPISMLQPFWTEPLSADSPPWLRGSEDYAKVSHALFQVVNSPEEADVIVQPFDWLTIRGNTWTAQINQAALELALQFADMAKKAGKPLMIFFSSDCSHEEIPIKDAFVFRQSLLASRRTSKDFSLTAIYEDLMKYYLGNHLPIRPKPDKPIVGFNGFANQSSWKIKLKEIAHLGTALTKGNLGFLPYQGHLLRSEAMKYLSNSSLVETNFVIRDRMVFFETNDVEQQMKVRLEYTHSLVESDYILCCRGRGNFSIRLFEALCCGRIPVLVNTDCVLPYDFAIDWKKYCVWVESKNLSQIAQKVATFHRNLSPEDFVKRQQECRQLWETWLSTDGFFRNFHTHFQLMLAR